MNIKVHNIGGYIVKNYLLETPRGIIAIDTGYPGGMARFKSRFEKKWPLSKLKYIFLTHHHNDHPAFLRSLHSRAARGLCCTRGPSRPARAIPRFPPRFFPG